MSEEQTVEKTGLDAEIEAAEQEAPKDESSSPEEETQAEPEKEEQQPEKKPGYVKRIDKLTAEKYRLQAERDELERKLNERTQTTPDAAAPTLEQFDYDDSAYQTALIDYRVQKALTEGLGKIEQQQKESQFNKQIETFGDKVRAAKIQDYEERVGRLVDNNVMLPYNVIEAIHKMDNGPHVLAHLGDNLDMADDLIKSDPVTAGMLLRDISAKMQPKSKKTTNAPDPIRPASSGGGDTSKDLDAMSMADIMKL